MRLVLSLTCPARGPEAVDVAVEAPEGTRFGALHEPLGAAASRSGLLDGAHGPLRTVHQIGGVPLHDDAVVGLPPLLHGATVTLDVVPAGTSPRPSVPSAADTGPGCAVVTVVVASGPSSGTRWSLPAGHHLVGREAGCAVELADARASRRHAVLRVRTSGVQVADLGSTNGSALTGPGGDSTALTGGWTTLEPHGELVVGSSTLRLEDRSCPSPARGDGAVPPASSVRGRPTGDGRLVLDPPAAALLKRTPRTIELPVRPAAPVPPRTSWLAVVLPLVLAVVMAIVWSPMALLFGLAAPVMVLGTSWGERRAGARRHAGELAQHARSCAAARERAGTAMARDAAVLRALGPDPGTLASAAAHRGPALWSRGRGEVVLRLGTGQVAAAVEVRSAPGQGDDQDAGDRDRDGDQPLLDEAAHRGCPVLLSPSELGVIGLAGPREACLALVRSMLVGAAVLHSPARLRLAVAGTTWGGAAWLPHALLSSGGSDEAAVFAEVAALVRARREQDASRSGRASARRPDVLVVLDPGGAGPGSLPAVVLEHGPACGVHVLAVAEHLDELPAGCGAVVEVGGPGGGAGGGLAGGLGSVRRLVADQDDAGWLAGSRRPSLAPGCEPGAPVRLDLVPEAAADATARHLAPLRARGGDAEEGNLPERLSLVEVLTVDAMDAGAVARGWARRPRSAVAVLGALGSGGSNGWGRWEVDLERDGPHALVAGTTGAGKSELLATLVTSLAVVNAPQECAFVLVDYKGGAAFADLVALPHVVGMVTDLDTHLPGRALASLGAEVRRRERVLAAAGCRDHAELTARRAGGDDLPVVPRLVVVVDEFRVLAEEVPDFLGGLVRLAAVGRSLGIHLVLATQRPAGVVSADIRANTSLRIALRVQDETDSSDVIDHRGAARISAALPGRALVAAAGGAPVPVQAARVAGVSAVRQAGAAGASPTVSITALVTGRSPGEAPGPARTDTEEEPAAEACPPPGSSTSPGPLSDVARIVAAVRLAAAGTPAPASPWLPTLPDVVPLPLTGAGEGGSGGEGGDDAGLTVGIVDLPAEQRRAPLVVDVSGPLLVVGAPRTGRSSALAAIAATASGRPDGAHAYLVARTSPPLVGAERLGCVGAVVDPDDHERLVRLLSHLVDLVVARQRGATLGRAPGGGPCAPLTLLLVAAAGRVLAGRDPPPPPPGEDVGDLVHRLLTDGPAVGVVVVLAGDRQLLGGRWGPVVARRWLLAATDPTDHVMAGVPSRDVPSRMPAGRVLVVGGEAGTVVGQIGLLAGGTIAAGPAAPLSVHATATGHHGAPPPRVPGLPSRLGLTEVLERHRRGPTLPRPEGPAEEAEERGATRRSASRWRSFRTLHRAPRWRSPSGSAGRASTSWPSSSTSGTPGWSWALRARGARAPW